MFCSSCRRRPSVLPVDYIPCTCAFRSCVSLKDCVRMVCECVYGNDVHAAYVSSKLHNIIMQAIPNSSFTSKRIIYNSNRPLEVSRRQHGCCHFIQSIFLQSS